MVFDKEETIKFWTFGAIILLGILTFLLLKPVLIAVFSGLILAYLLMPVYHRILKTLKSKNLSATIILISVILIVVIPLWLIIPVTINQFFDVFKISQTIDPTHILSSLFPGASNDFLTQASITLTALISKLSSLVVNSLVNFFTEAPTFFLNVFVMGFVFFFGLRDSDKLAELAREVSPLNKAKEKLLVQQFKDITDAIIYGNIIVGVVQGILAGIGFLIFGVDKAILLTLLAIFFSMIPILGPYVVYLPVAIFMFVSGNITTGIAYMTYNLLIVSTLDNFLRTYIISKKTQISSAVVFVGMIAGMYMFGIMGLLLGPLILAYFLIIIQLYREKELSSLFVREEEVAK